jgi:hypothetical protein
MGKETIKERKTQDARRRTQKTAGDLQVEQFEARRAELESTLKKPVFLIRVPNDTVGTSWSAAYIGKPSRQTVSIALALTAEKQPLQASEILLRESWIEGDENILEDDDLFYAAHMAIQGVIEFRVGVLKKN